MDKNNFSLVNTKTVLLVLFSFFTVWWLILYFFVGENYVIQELFSATYGVIALFGGVIGLGISQKWGGLKSHLGKAILFFSLGLLLQEFGQFAYSFYSLILQIEIPYPSLGDIGYFGSIPFYILGAIYISKAVGLNYLIKKPFNTLLLIVIPILSIVSAYKMFLSGYDFTEFSLVMFLDFGYPLGQSLYVAFAFVIYLISLKELGGIMKSKILLFLVALVFQYLADFYFLYLISMDLWDTAGLNEYMYMFAYFLMAFAIIEIDIAYKNVIDGKTKQNG
jgi:hypothetical protein